MSREFIALALMGIDQHENGVMAVAGTLRDAQMKVEYYGKFQSPKAIAERAIKEDAGVVGISCHSWEYMTLVPQLIEALRVRGSSIPVIIGGSVITPLDAEEMRNAGVAGVFATAMDAEKIVDCIRDLNSKHRQKASRDIRSADSI